MTNVLWSMPELLFLRCVVSGCMAVSCVLLLLRDRRDLPWRWMLAGFALMGLSRYILLLEIGYGHQLYLSVPEVILRITAFLCFINVARRLLGHRYAPYLFLQGLVALAALASPTAEAGEVIAKLAAGLAFWKAARTEKATPGAFRLTALGFAALSLSATRRIVVTWLEDGGPRFFWDAGLQFTPLDAAINLAASLLLAFALWRCYVHAPYSDQYSWPRSLRRLAVMTVAVGLALLVGVAASNDAATDRDEDLRTLLLARAQTAASALDPAQIEIAQSSGPKSEEHHGLTKRLKAISVQNPDIKYVYILEDDAGLLRFLAEAPPDDPSDRLEPGTPFPEAPPELHHILQTDEPAVIGPAVDRWGAWMTAAAPLRNAAHTRVLAVLGMDIPATEWSQTVNAGRLAPLTFTLLFIYFLFGVELLLLLRRAAAERIARSERSYRALFQHMPLGFLHGQIVLDEAGRAIDWIYLEMNEAYERHVGVPRINLIGQRASKCAPEFHRYGSQLLPLFERIAVTGEPVTTVYFFPVAERWICINAYCPEPGHFAGTAEDISEQRRTWNALRDSEARMSAIFDTAADGIIVITEQRTIQQVNPAACRMFNYAPDELIGQKADILLPEPYAGEYQEYLRRYLETGQAQILNTVRELHGARKDASTFPVELSLGEAKTGAGRAFTGIVRDITSRRRAEAELIHQRSLLSAVLDAAALLINAHEHEQSIIEAFRQVAGAADVDRVYVFENIEDARNGEPRASLRFEYANATVVSRLNDPRLQNLAWNRIFPQWYGPLSQGQTIRGVGHDFRPSERRRLRQQQTQSIVVAPVIANGRFWGIVGFDECHFERVWSETEVSILELFASIISGIIMRQRAESGVRESNALLRAVQDIQSRYIAETAPNLLFQRLLVEMQTFSFSALGFIAKLTHKPSGQTCLEILAQRGGAKIDPGFEICDLDTLVGETVKRCEPLIVNDAAMAALPVGFPPGSGPLKTFLGLPLLRGKTAVGVIALANRPDDYAPALVERLAPLTTSCANILEAYNGERERQRAIEALERQREWLAVTLSSIGDAVIATDTDARITFLNPVAERLTGWSINEAFGVPLDEVFRIIEATTLRPAPSPVAEALSKRKIVELADDTSLVSRNGDVIPIDDSAAPIQDARGRIHGAVLIFRDVTERKRHEAELALARDREVEIGSRIQQTLLLGQPPEKTPAIEAAVLTVPSQRIDGDFYDFFQHGDQGLSIIVGDVMGKGVPAALMGAATRSAFHRAMSELLVDHPAGSLPRPDEVVNRMHRLVTPRLLELESFVTLCHIHLDLQNKTADFVDCGHTKTIHWHAATNACTLIEGDNLPLGVLESEVYEQRRATFQDGDVFVLYSDGLTDLINDFDERFGQEALLELVMRNAELPPDEFIGAVWSALVAFSNRTAFSDDLTCVVVRVGGPDEPSPLSAATAHFELDLRELVAIRAFTRAQCAAAPAPPSDEETDALELAVNEAATNVIKHAYVENEEGFDISAEIYRDKLVLRIQHRGEAFYDGFAPPPTFDATRFGGFGAHIIRESVDAVSYLRALDGMNCIKLVKRFENADRQG